MPSVYMSIINQGFVLAFVQDVDSLTEQQTLLIWCEYYQSGLKEFFIKPFHILSHNHHKI